MSVCLDAWSLLDSERETTSIIVPKPLGAFASMLIRGSIPWSAVDRWCKSRGLERAEQGIVEQVIARLDRDRAEREASRLNK
jgi:hypothetical protein